MFAYLLQGITLGFSAAVTPGPFQAYLLAQSSHKGWKRTLPAAFAPIITDGPIIFLVVFLLSRTPPWLLQLIRFAGGLFLLYLSWEALNAYRRYRTVSGGATLPDRGNLIKAVVVNAMSPGPYLFWGVLAGPILIDGWRRSKALGVSFIAGFYGTLIGGFALLVLIFAGAAHTGPRVNRYLLLVSALALMMFGFYQIWQGVVAWRSV